jgi:1-acyl-sn-glycerol-3-phosphate acyltransferase
LTAWTIAQGLRSLLGLLGALLLWIPGGVVIRLVILPLAWLRPTWQAGLVTGFMKAMAFGIFASLRAGGARFERCGRLDTSRPTLVVMNHQSLLDILSATLMAAPYVPAFVTRRRYARFIPLVSPCIRLLGGPVIDPKRDRRGAVLAIREAALGLRHGLLIFPEGHRSLDGELRAFRTAGIEAILGARRLPVQLVVTDGFWKSRRFVDFVFNVHRIRGRTELLGELLPPEEPEALPAFIDSLRQRLAEGLSQLRQEPDAP